MEEWRDVVGYEGLYKVSNFGNVMRIKVSTIAVPRLLKLQDAGTCLTVILHKSGKAVSHRVHRLVATAFIPNSNSFPFINHIDGNYRNNATENLEWCTARHNAAHGMGRPVNIREGDKVTSFPSVSAAARYLGCHMANIYYYAKNDIPTKDGIYVSFADELKQMYRTSGSDVLNK